MPTGPLTRTEPAGLPWAVAALLLVLVAAACGSGGPEPRAASTPVTTSAAPAPTPATTGPAASPAPPAAASPAAPADAAQVVDPGSGSTTVVPGGTQRSGSGPLRRYSVAVEGGLGVDGAAFAAVVDATLADPRSWGAGGRLSFQRVDSGRTDVQVVLASPTTADRLCRPLDTAGIYSCGVGSRAVINSMRWLRGADAYAGHLDEYRQYVVNHEVGHTLGHHHQGCPGAGEPAPVMMQQTKGVGACVPVSWPFA